MENSFCIPNIVDNTYYISQSTGVTMVCIPTIWFEENANGILCTATVETKTSYFVGLLIVASLCPWMTNHS